MNDRSEIRPVGSRLLAHLQLFRFPNVFTALADVMMGFLFVQQSFTPVVTFLLLATTSALLYSAGMVLNDVYDIGIDASQRPPSGRCRRDAYRSAGRRWLGYEMLVLGVVLGWLAGYSMLDAGSSMLDAGSSMLGGGEWMRSGVVATVLAVCIWLYDALLKRTLAGPVLMGLCRFLNVLLGMSVASDRPHDGWLLSYRPDELMVAGGIGIYIAGVTWYARSEATTSRRSLLAISTAMMVAGVTMLACFPYVAESGRQFYLEPQLIWPLTLVVIGLAPFRRCVVGVMDPQPHRVQAAVIQCLFTLILLDASVSLMTSYWYALAVLALIVPNVVLRRWIYST